MEGTLTLTVERFQLEFPGLVVSGLMSDTAPGKSMLPMRLR